MSCKYKKFHEKCTSPYCEVTYGECQFVKDAYDDVCSIRGAYLGGVSDEPLIPGQVRVNFRNNTLAADEISTYAVGEQYGSLPEVSARGCIFLGWYTRQDQRITTSSVVELSDTELYSRWEDVTVNDGTFLDISTDSTYNRVGIYYAAMYIPARSPAIPLARHTGDDGSVTYVNTSAQTSAIYVDWGDGCVEKHLTSINKLVHAYESHGRHVARVSNNVTQLAMGGDDNSWTEGAGWTGNICCDNRYTLLNLSQIGSRTQLKRRSFYCCGISSLDFLSSRNDITSIPEYCFHGCKNLLSLSGLPSSIRELDSGCFADTNLSGNVDLRGTSLTGLTIGGVFSGCKYATSYTFPDSIVGGGYVGQYLFRGNSRLSSMDLPSSLTYIDRYCFDGCSSLQSITIPARVECICDAAFSGCTSLSNVQYETNVLTSIERWAFYGDRSLRDLAVPDSVTRLGDYAFQNCSSTYASSLVLPSSLTSIGDMTYCGCKGLRNVTIPSSLASADYLVFSNCPKLSGITDLRLTAQTCKREVFGQVSSANDTQQYTGYDTRGSNVLSIYVAAEGYDQGQWLDPLQNASKCGFGIQYIDPENAKYCTITFDAGEGTVGTTSVRVMYTKRLGTLPTPVCPESTPYFGGWYTEENGGGTRYGASSRCPKQETLVLHAYYDATPLVYYTVDLNGQWRQSTSQANPDSTLYDGAYESSSNYNVGNGYAKMYVRMVGYETFSVYIRSYAESNYDYVVAMNADTDVTSNPSSSTSGVRAHTMGSQKSGTAIANYTKVTYDGLGGGSHYICIVYRKDGSGNSGNDRGYVLIPKNQE